MNLHRYSLRPAAAKQRNGGMIEYELAAGVAGLRLVLLAPATDVARFYGDPAAAASRFHVRLAFLVVIVSLLSMSDGMLRGTLNGMSDSMLNDTSNGRSDGMLRYVK